MKSMLHEASTVAKAIQKAWEEAGRPEDFKIRVLEYEKNKFFGLMTESPAVVSISYEPVKKTASASETQRSSHNQQSHQKKNTKIKEPAKENSRTKEASAASDSKAKASTYQTEKKDKLVRKKIESDPHGKKTTTPANPSLTTIQEKNQEKENAELWTKEHEQFIHDELIELHNLLGITSRFSLKIEQKILQVIYGEQLCKSNEEERMYYISLSYLLMQFLKKQYKKRFRGYQILITREAS